MGIAILSASMVYILITVLSSTPLQSANDRSRWCTVYSLVERGTYQIDEIDQHPDWSTIDKVRHRHSPDEPYHFYSSKPPLLSTLVAGLYWIERNTVGYSILDETTLVCRLLLVIVNVIPMGLALFSFRRTLIRLDIEKSAYRFLLLTVGFASMLNPFLTTLNNHTPAAICVFLCLSGMVRICDESHPAPIDFAIVGASAALACCFELPSALFGVLSFVFVVCHDPRKTLKWYVPAAFIPLIAFFITNYVCTGGIKPFYSYYGTEKYLYVHEGVPSYWMNPQGIDSRQESVPVYLFHCVLGHHGILSITPIFLVTLVGWWMTLRSPTPKLLPIQAMGVTLSLAILLFFLSRTQNYNYGGNSATLRWMLWLTPFWLYGMIPGVEWLAKTKRGVMLVSILIAVSSFSSVYSVRTPWKPGWIFQAMERVGWIDYRTKVKPFPHARFSVFSCVTRTPGASGQWQSESNGSVKQLTITVEQSVSPDSDSMVRLLAVLHQKQDGRHSSQTANLVLLTDRFDAGVDIVDWLRAPPDSETKDSAKSMRRTRPAPDWIVGLLRGMPFPREFNPESPRYLKYVGADGEKTAIRCERGASRVAFSDSVHGKCWQRCDVLYNDELPFGAAQWKITVTRDLDQQLLKVETWASQNLP